jgi:hypothetical protein
MISHRNLIFSASDSVSVNEETMRVYPVWCSYLYQKCEVEDNLQIVDCPGNASSIGSPTLVPCNGRTFLHIPGIPQPLHISRTPPLEC